jgi:hypothetical protein
LFVGWSGICASSGWHPGHVQGALGFVGRYREQWALHGALFAADLPLTQEVMHGPVAIVAGLPGTRKTALVAAYAWQFGGDVPLLRPKAVRARLTLMVEGAPLTDLIQASRLDPAVPTQIWLEAPSPPTAVPGAGT